MRGPAIAALARAVEKDIDCAAEALQEAEHPRIHTFLATSPMHMEYKLRKKPDEVVEMAVHAVRHARNKVAEVEFSPEDATRSEIPFLCRVIEKVIDAGARIINVPDTVGYTMPAEFTEFLRAIIEGTPNMDKAVLSVHCHNDLGVAVANSVAAVRAGARQVEVTVNGIGERAGNASLEEFVMALCGPRGHPPLHHRHQHPADLEHLAPAGEHDRLPHPAQQADHGRERVRPRIGHPPGRRAEEARDLRDHDPRVGRDGMQASSCWGATPACTVSRTGLSELGLAPDRGGGEEGLRAVPGNRGPQEGSLRRRPVRHRRGPARP